MKRILQLHGKSGRIYTWLPAIVLFAVFIIPIIGIGVTSFSNRDDVEASTPESSSTNSANPTATTAGCDPMYQQVQKTEGNNQVVEDFATRYAQATATATTLSDAQIQVVLESAGKSALTLAAYGNAFGLYPDTNKWAELADGGCLSSEGIKLHNQLEGVLKAKGTTTTEAQAPEDGYNTGIENGVYGVDSAQGVYGDRTAVKFVLKDGSVVYIMVRCGNPVFPGQPSLPPVKTDNVPPEVTPPTKVTPPSPTPTTPPTLTPKPADPSQWVYPPEKPRVAPVTSAPEATPPAVVTEQTGGGGVVDTPTKTPGSETGVTAPNAEPPAPVRTEAPLPPNEGTGSGPTPTVAPTAPAGDPGGF